MVRSTDSGKQENIPTHHDEELKGTAVGVSLIGAFILVLWLIIFYLYVSRL